MPCRFPLLSLALALALALAALAAPGTRGQELTHVTLALDWYPWSNHTGLYLAQERGYFRDEGLDVSIYVPANPEDVLKLVGSGKDTFGISYQTDVLLARAEGVPVTSIAAMVQHPLNSVMTLQESGITRPQQLEGRTVGYPGIPSNEALLKTMVEHDGGDFSKVKLVNVGFDLVPALIGKRVDAIIGAYWVHESILAELQGHPVNIMRVEQYGVPDFYELLLVASDDTVAQQADVVRRFLRATVKGYQDAAADHAAALDALVRANPETNWALEERGIELLAPLWTEGVPGFGWQTRERWQSYHDWLRQNGLLSRDVEIDRAFQASLLPALPATLEPAPEATP